MQLSTQFSSKVSIPVLLILVIQNGLMEWYGKRGTDFGQKYIYIYMIKETTRLVKIMRSLMEKDISFKKSNRITVDFCLYYELLRK